MNRCQFLFSLCVWWQILINANGCERSLEARGVEDYCWTKKIEVIERLQYTGKSVLNFAKKKLGLDVETDEGPQKCDYYMCIFQELKMLNSNNYPCYERMTNWIRQNVVYNHALVLLSQVDKCSEGLSNSTISGTYFIGDKVGEDVSSEGIYDGVLYKTLFTESDVTPAEPQSKCDIAAEYMKCMSLIEKEEKCPVYQYP